MVNQPLAKSGIHPERESRKDQSRAASLRVQWQYCRRFGDLRRSAARRQKGTKGTTGGAVAHPVKSRGMQTRQCASPPGGTPRPLLFLDQVGDGVRQLPAVIHPHLAARVFPPFACGRMPQPNHDDTFRANTRDFHRAVAVAFGSVSCASTSWLGCLNCQLC